MVLWALAGSAAGAAAQSGDPPDDPIPERMFPHTLARVTLSWTDPAVHLSLEVHTTPEYRLIGGDYSFPSDEYEALLGSFGRLPHHGRCGEGSSWIEITKPGSYYLWVDFFINFCGDQTRYPTRAAWSMTVEHIDGRRDTFSGTAPLSQVDGPSFGRQFAGSIDVLEVPANLPPAITGITVDPPDPVAGDTVEVTAIADDMDGDPLTYSWRVDDAPVSGSGSAITLPDVTEGDHTVLVVVGDDRGASDEVSTSFTVEPAGAIAADGSDQANGPGVVIPPQMSPGVLGGALTGDPAQVAQLIDGAAEDKAGRFAEDWAAVLVAVGVLFGGAALVYLFRWLLRNASAYAPEVEERAPPQKRPEQPDSLSRLDPPRRVDEPYRRADETLTPSEALIGRDARNRPVRIEAGREYYMRRLYLPPDGTATVVYVPDDAGGGQWVYVDRSQLVPLEHLRSYTPDYSVPPPPPIGVDLSVIGQTYMEPLPSHVLRVYEARDPRTGSLSTTGRVLEPGTYLTAKPVSGTLHPVYDHHTKKWCWVTKGGEPVG